MTVQADPFSTQKREADEFLSGGGSTMIAAKWPTVGAVVEGTITAWEGPVQKTDMESGELLYFEAKKMVKESDLRGNPATARKAMELRVDLQCEATGITWKTNQYIEEEVPDDDGMRRMYISGALQKAFAAAKEAAGTDGVPAPLETGAYVKITRTKSKKMPNGFFAYTFEGEWTPAKQNAKAADGFLSDDAEENPFAE
jgi:hypothetical protein